MIVELIIAGLVLIAWIGSIVWTYERGGKSQNAWIFHGVAWGRFRESGDGIVNDYGNCLDHSEEDCPYG